MAIEKLQGNTQYAVHEQFPLVTIKRKRELLPFMIDAREMGHHAITKEDIYSAFTGDIFFQDDHKKQPTSGQKQKQRDGQEH